MAQPRNLRAVPETTRRAGLYVRVSDVHGRSGEAFHSPDQQLEAMKALAQRSGWEVAHVWTDLDRTGRTFHREGIQAALSAVDAGQVDVLVTYDVSRLGRNTAESLSAISRVRAAGAVFASVSEQIDDTPAGQLALTMFLGLAQHYSDTMSLRWQDIHRRVFEQGRPLGFAPLGYAKDWTPDPVWAPAIRALFARYAAGTGLKALAADLAEQTGRPYWPATVRKTLRSPVYLGMVRWKGQIRPGRHEPLVEREVWNRVQARMDAESTGPRRRIHVSWSLSGLAVCDLCSKPLTKKEQQRSTGRVAYVFCHNPRAEDASRCEGIGQPQITAVEAEVLRKVEAHLARLRDDVDTRLAVAARKRTAASTVDTLQRDLGKVREARARTATDWAMRTITIEDRDAVYARLDDRARALERRLAELGPISGAVSERPAASKVARMLRMWDRLTVEERKAAIRTVVREVRVRRAAVRASKWQPHDMEGRVEVAFY